MSLRCPRLPLAKGIVAEIDVFLQEGICAKLFHDSLLWNHKTEAVREAMGQPAFIQGNKIGRDFSRPTQLIGKAYACPISVALLALLPSLLA